MRSVFSVMSFLPIIVCEFACGVAESSATVAIAMNFFIGFGFISVEFCFFSLSVELSPGWKKPFFRRAGFFSAWRDRFFKKRTSAIEEIVPAPSAGLLPRKKCSRHRRQSFYLGRNAPDTAGKVSTPEEVFPIPSADFLPRQKVCRLRGWRFRRG